MHSFYVIVLLILLTFLMLLNRPKARPRPSLPPGPRQLPIIGNLHMLGRLPHRSLAKLAQKYGPIMFLRLGRVPSVVISSPKAAELFLKQNDAVFASRPKIQASMHLSYGTKGMGLTPYGDYWRQVRRITRLHLLSAAKMQEFEGLRTKEMVAAVRKLAAAREVVDVGEIVGGLIEGILFKMVVGKGKEKGKIYDLKEIVGETLGLMGAFNFADFVPFLAPFDFQGLNRKMEDVSKRVDEVFEYIIDNHLKEGDLGQRRDILGAMLAGMKNPCNEFLSCFDRDSVKAIMFDLFIGGIDTSLVTVTWALSALLKYPRVMQLLQEELDFVVGNYRMVSESNLSKLSFLDMVVKETFRLYPAAPLLVPHESIEDRIVDGYIIPKGSRIIINAWAIGRDPTTWSKRVEEFHPERFIGRDIDILGRDFELIPFGAGRRGCPGSQFGLTMVKLLVAQLTHCFNWDLPHGMQPEKMDMSEKFGLSMPRAKKLLAIPFYRLHVKDP